MKKHSKSLAENKETFTVFLAVLEVIDFVFVGLNLKQYDFIIKLYCIKRQIM